MYIYLLQVMYLKYCKVNVHTLLGLSALFIKGLNYPRQASLLHTPSYH